MTQYYLILDSIEINKDTALSINLYRSISLAELGLKEEYSEKNFDKCVKRLELSEGLFLCAALNLASTNSIHKDFRGSQFFISSALNVDMRVRERIQFLLNEDPGLIVLGRLQLLHLMIAIALRSRDTPKHWAKPVRQNDFLQAAIKAGHMANAEWFHSCITPDPKLSSVDNIRKRLPAMRVMAQFGLLYRNPYQQSLGRLKAILLDEMFSRDSELADIFLQTVGMSIENFIYAGTAVLTVGIKSNVLRHPKVVPPNYFNFNGSSLWAENQHNKHVIEKFLDAFSATPVQLRQFLEKQEDQSSSNYANFKLLRERPLIKSNIDSYVVADADFFIRAIEVGPLFQIINSGKRNAQSVFGSFGKAFERYCKRIISDYNAELVKHGSNGHLGTNVYVTNSRQRELDISLTYRDTIVLIECKAVWLNDKYLSNDKHPKFWDHLMERVGVSIDPATQEEHRQGLAQLVDLIELMSLKDSRFSDPRVKPEDLKQIFPILLMHDSLFSVPDFGYLLALEFAQLLGQNGLSSSGYFEYNGLSIANLILLTADEVEWLISRGSKESLLTILEKYSSAAPTRFEKNFGSYIHDHLTSAMGSKNPLTEPAKVLFDTVIERFLPASDKNTLIT